MALRLTRRSFAAGLPGVACLAAPGKGQEFAADRQRFLDPTTEFEITRLTAPSYTSLLPPVRGRAISRHADFLVYCSDRSGSMQVHRLDLKATKDRQLTEVSGVHPPSLMLAQDRWIYFFDGPRFLQVAMSNLKERTLHECAEPWKATGVSAVSGDGLFSVFAETNGERSRLQQLSTGRPSATVLAELDGGVEAIELRPRRGSALYLSGGDMRLISFDKRENRTLRTAEGTVLDAHWSPDGRTILYLLKPSAEGKLIELREMAPDTNADSFVSKTSQFASFAMNGDASVFLGASGSKASPFLLLLARSVRRELTLCEHRNSDAARTSATFSPNSTRVFFHTDRHGKPCIYSMAVNRLVEETEND